MIKYQLGGAFNDQPREAEKNHIGAQEETHEALPIVSSSSESRLATWHISDDLYLSHSGSVGSLGFSSHGSQGIENVSRFPQDEGNWIVAWIKQCDFSVPPEEPQPSEDILEDINPFDNEIDAVEASKHRYSRYNPDKWAASSTDVGVPSNWASSHHSSIQPYADIDSLDVEKHLIEISETAPWKDQVSLHASTSSYLQSQNFHSAASSKQSSTASSVNPIDTYSNTNSSYQSADSGHYSNNVSLTGSYVSTAGSHASLTSSHASLAESQASMTGSLASLAGSQSNRKGKRKATGLPCHDRKSPEGKPYQCTWCFRAFKRRQDWTRHESSSHFALKQFVCMPNGPMEPSSSPPFLNYCVFCKLRESDPEHLVTQHGTAACLAKSFHERSFPRKDGLVQHINGSHADGLLINPNELAQRWQRDGDLNEHDRRWECGFCGQDNMDWPARCEHVADHFREGSDMRCWVGRDPNDHKYYCDRHPCPAMFNKRGVEFPSWSDLMVHLMDQHRSSSPIAYSYLQLRRSVQRTQSSALPTS